MNTQESFNPEIDTSEYKNYKPFRYQYFFNDLRSLHIIEFASMDGPKDTHYSNIVVPKIISAKLFKASNRKKELASILIQLPKKAPHIYLEPDDYVDCFWACKTRTLCDIIEDDVQIEYFKKSISDDALYAYQLSIKDKPERRTFFK